MEWHFTDDRPIYAQLIEEMERALATGGYAPGEKLPGVRELAAEAGVNPNTMQRAMAALEERGLLHSQRTSGRFVTEDRQKLDGLRTGLAGAVTGEYLAKMQALGYSHGEILQFVQRTVKEGN